MKLWILSDLHIESCVWNLPEPKPDYDVLIAAGDIHTPASRGVDWLADQAGGKPIIYVPGNHEWYARPIQIDIPAERKLAKARARERGVHWLERQTLILNGVRFLGATLWTDFELFGTPLESMRFADKNMYDYYVIFPQAGSDKPFSPLDSAEFHQTDRAWLIDEMSRKFDGPTVVVTHHLPHRGSIAPRFANDALTPAFCSDLENLIRAGAPELWVHGHTHDSFDYLVGGTRIVCNPKGYGPKQKGAPIENGSFKSRLIVEV